MAQTFQLQMPCGECGEPTIYHTDGPIEVHSLKCSKAAPSIKCPECGSREWDEQSGSYTFFDSESITRYLVCDAGHKYEAQYELTEIRTGNELKF